MMTKSYWNSNGDYHSFNFYPTLKTVVFMCFALITLYYFGMVDTLLEASTKLPELNNSVSMSVSDKVATKDLDKIVGDTVFGNDETIIINVFAAITAIVWVVAILSYL